MTSSANIFFQTKKLMDKLNTGVDSLINTQEIKPNQLKHIHGPQGLV